MTDTSRELTELKKEVFETRNQAIKTDNQVKNLGLNIKTFEKRFDLLERRTRLASVGANIVVAVVVTVAAFLVYNVRTGSLTGAVESSKAEAEAAQKRAAQRVAQMQKATEELEAKVARRDQVERAIATFIKHIDAGQEKSAEKVVETIDLDAVGPALRAMVETRVDEFRSGVAETSYKNGRTHATANRHAQAVGELERSLNLAPNGRWSESARYLLANSLWSLNKFEEAVPVLQTMLETTKERALVDELRHTLGACLARSGNKEEAIPVLKKVVSSSAKYATSAREYLTALESGAELPPLAPSRAKTTPSRTTHPTPAAPKPTSVTPTPTTGAPATR